MKQKLLITLLLCTLTISITACGSTKKASEPATPNEPSVTESNAAEEPTTAEESTWVEESFSIEETTTAEETSAAGEEGAPYALGNSADLKDWSINVTDVKIVDSIAGSLGSFSPKEEGNTYVQVFVTVENTGKTADSFLPSFCIGDDVNAKVLYSDGYEFTASNLLGYTNDLHDSTINPLSSKTGEIVYEIRKRWIACTYTKSEPSCIIESGWLG
ncbi:MAG: DUF4352 domain-containing protein, partial [Lachnospiraceae bacterium]